MTRQKRILPADIPVHVVHRGQNKCDTFTSHNDYEQYLIFLQKALKVNGCDLHSYVLMTNHIHLLLTPHTDYSISKVMHTSAGRYTRYFNAINNRTGSLWEGRFKSCPITNDRYFLACMRYIELNPVRAGMALTPGEYTWTSYHFNALGKENKLLKAHPYYSAPGQDSASTLLQYRLMFEQNINISANYIAPKGSFS